MLKCWSNLLANHPLF